MYWSRVTDYPTNRPRNTAKYKLNAATTSLQILSSSYRRWKVRRSPRHVSCIAHSKCLTYDRSIFIWTEHFQCFCEMWELGMRYREFCESIPRHECHTEKGDLWESFGWHVKSWTTRKYEHVVLYLKTTVQQLFPLSWEAGILYFGVGVFSTIGTQRHFLTVN